MADSASRENLSLQNGHRRTEENGTRRLLALGEVLWDVFDHSMRLGGAALNFSVHAKRLGYDPLLISGLGYDELGERAAREITSLGLDQRFVLRTCKLETGTARVELGPGDRTRFLLSRPAAYDAVNITEDKMAVLQQWSPAWFYFGT